MTDQIIIKTYQNHSVQFRAEDGWMSVTKLVKAYNKQLHHFWQQPNWKSFQADKDYTDADFSGTWVEPGLAIALAQWLDKDFGLWVFNHRPQRSRLPSTLRDSYINVYEFQQLNGSELEKADKTRLSFKVKELTLSWGMEVTNPPRIQVTEQGRANTSKNNAYPYRAWLSAYEALGLAFAEQP